MIVLDTNSILRLITRDIPKDEAKVRKLLEDNEELFIPDVVFPEIEYILLKAYFFTRPQIVNVFAYLSGLSSVRVSIEVRAAVKLFAETKLDMADCIIAAHAKGEVLASFDNELIKASGVKNYWP